MLAALQKTSLAEFSSALNAPRESRDHLQRTRSAPVYPAKVSPVLGKFLEGRIKVGGGVDKQTFGKPGTPPRLRFVHGSQLSDGFSAFGNQKMRSTLYLVQQFREVCLGFQCPDFKGFHDRNMVIIVRSVNRVLPWMKDRKEQISDLVVVSGCSFRRAVKPYPDGAD